PGQWRGQPFPARGELVAARRRSFNGLHFNRNIPQHFAQRLKSSAVAVLTLVTSRSARCQRIGPARTPLCPKVATGFSNWPLRRCQLALKWPPSQIPPKMAYIFELESTKVATSKKGGHPPSSPQVDQHRSR